MPVVAVEYQGRTTFPGTLNKETCVVSSQFSIGDTSLTMARVMLAFSPGVKTLSSKLSLQEERNRMLTALQNKSFFMVLYVLREVQCQCLCCLVMLECNKFIHVKSKDTIAPTTDHKVRRFDGVPFNLYSS